jgi:hypothetical protein
LDEYPLSLEALVSWFGLGPNCSAFGGLLDNPK